MTEFVVKQLRELKEMDLIVILRKIRTAFLRAVESLLMGISVPFVLIMRALRPVILIRFGSLESSRIGHFAINTEVYLSECDIGMHGTEKTLDVFYHKPPACNYQLKRMWDRVLPVRRMARILDKTNKLIPGGEEHVIPFRVNACRDIYGVLPKTQPHIYFTNTEEQKGRDEMLLKLGISERAPFVCFHARTGDYLRKVLPGGDWGYHDYRDSDINNYVMAAEELTNRGYFAVRMGAHVKKKLNTGNRKVIDYATNERTDFLDMYLSAKCDFFICDTAGIYAVAELFRKPIAWVNYTTFEYVPSYGKDHLFIPKKLWLAEEHRFLTFREILESGVGRYMCTCEYKKDGIELIENTPEEIKALSVEMDERLKGKWYDAKESNELQDKFWKFFPQNQLNRVIQARIGSEFLFQNRDLL
ncbi:TIGR04372 family glycosyltransferase [Candidatus Omnitrophota bacterium]